MTQEKYVEILGQKLKLMEQIADNTKRQVRFLQNEHRSLRGLMRLLQMRGKLLQQLDALQQKAAEGMEWQNCLPAKELEKTIQCCREKIAFLHTQAIQAATEEKNRVASHLNGNRVTQTIRNVYIGRWYQGMSRGFNRSV